MGLGNAIKNHLKESGRSTVWLAERSGINQNTLYAMIKRDSNYIEADNLVKICRALEINPLELYEEAIAEESSTEGNELRVKYLRKASEIIAREFNLKLQTDRTQNISTESKAHSNRAILVDDLTEDEVSMLLEYKDYLIWRRNNGKI